MNDVTSAFTPTFTKTKSAKKRKDPNDKINKSFFNMTEQLHEAGKLIVLEGVSQKKINGNVIKENIVTPITLEYSQYTEKIMATKPRFNAFDREVLNACIAEQAVGNAVTTVNSIYRNMTGDSKDRKPSAEMVKLIKSSLSKLMFCEVEIDLTDVCVKYGYNSGKAPTLHSAILPGKYIESILNGQKIISVEFYEPSPLFIAAEIKNGQILSYDKNLLDVPLNNTPTIITVKSYLLRRICEIHAHKLTPVITFADIFEKNNLTELSKLARNRLREHIKKMLDFWLQENVISGYEMLKEGQSFYGIGLLFSKNKS